MTQPLSFYTHFRAIFLGGKTLCGAEQRREVTGGGVAHTERDFVHGEGGEIEKKGFGGLDAKVGNVFDGPHMRIFLEQAAEVTGRNAGKGGEMG